MLLDDLLHAGDHRAADVEVFLGDAVLPGGVQHGGVHGPQLGGGGGRQGPQLVLLLLLLTSTADDNTQAVTPQPLTKPGDYKTVSFVLLSYHDVLLVSLLLDVFVRSLYVLNVHRTELA